MIDFRYHVVSIVAVFLALALGLFIGSTSLRGKVANDLRHRTAVVTANNRELQTEVRERQQELDDAHEFDRALQPYVLHGQLAGQTVVVVSAPEVDGDLRSNVINALTEAGATINGDVRLQPTLLDVDQDQFLATLSDRLALPERTLPAGSGQERALALLADVLGTRPQDPPVGANAASRVLSAYADGKLVSVSGDPPHGAALAVLVTAPPPAPTTDEDATDDASLLARFAHELDQSATGAVVVGSGAAAVDGGAIDAVRSDKAIRGDVSTVDSVDLPSGIMATVLALVEQASGEAGSYGVTSSAEDPLPAPSPS